MQLQKRIDINTTPAEWGTRFESDSVAEIAEAYFSTPHILRLGQWRVVDGETVHDIHDFLSLNIDDRSEEHE